MGQESLVYDPIGPPAKRVRLEEPPSAEDSSPLASPTQTRSRGATKQSSGKGRRSQGAEKPHDRLAKRSDWLETEVGEKLNFNGDAKAERRPKRKVVLYIGYSGLAYSGLQVNPGVKTIEGTLFEGLAKAGGVSEDNADDPLKVGLHRAARTDAGVHAAINVLSLKLILDPPSKPAQTSIEDHLNAFLPDDIRIWKVTRVQNGFNPRTLCDARTYCYTFPSFVLLPPKPGSQMASKFAGMSGSTEWKPAASVWPNAETPMQPEEEAQARRAWRAPSHVIDRFRQMLGMMIGAHNFHNFTLGAAFSDRSSTRVMRDLKVVDPIVRETGVEWLVIELHGQSFMLHQIRKMIGLLILACRSPAPISLIPELFGPTKVMIPRAPALGLRLERPHFERYNRKVADTPKSKDVSQHRDALDYPPDLLQRVQAWTAVMIEPSMHNDKAFSDWIKGVDDNVGTELDYLNAEGIISSKPRDAVVPKAGNISLAAEDAEEDGVRGAAEDLEG